MTSAEYKRAYQQGYSDAIRDFRKNNKESIPYLMHKEMDIPLLDCQKAYNVAIDYLRRQVKIKG